MTLVYAGALLIGVALILAVIALFESRREPSAVAKSLALIGERNPSVTERTDAPSRSLIDQALEVAAHAGRRLTPARSIERLGRGLDRAGHPAPWTVERVMGAKGLSAVIGLFLGFLYGGGLGVKGITLGAVIGAALFHLPDLLIYNTGLRRQEQIMRGFAEALDMLTICVEAGQGFDAALLEVARNASGPIAGELARMTAEVQIGTSRSDAFRALGDRVSDPDVKNFVTAIAQADQLGIPIASVLREQTQAMRLARKQKAEAQAQKLTVKILFPLMVCIFPALMVVILGPAIIRAMQTFSHAS